MSQTATANNAVIAMRPTARNQRCRSISTLQLVSSQGYGPQGPRRIETDSYGDLVVLPVGELCGSEVEVGDVGGVVAKPFAVRPLGRAKHLDICHDGHDARDSQVVDGFSARNA